MKQLGVTMRSQRTYLPAAGRDRFLPLYDLMTRLMGADKARIELLDRAKIRPGHRVLDVGCGTGTLVIQLKRLCPDADVVGLDPDPKALARARHKAACDAVSVQLDRGLGMSFRTPRRPSTVCCPPSCSTTYPRRRRGRPCARSVASLNLAASFTCSISKGQRMVLTASCPAYFTQVTG